MAHGYLIFLVTEYPTIMHYYVFSDRGITVPVVTLVIGGGQGTLKNIQATLKRDLPVVIIKDSGRLADVFAFAFDEVVKTRLILA